MISSDIWHKYNELFQNCYTLFHELLSEWNLRQFWNITSIFAKYHVQIMLLIVYTTNFKLSWNTAALSQSNCRNFSCSSINTLDTYVQKQNYPWPGNKTNFLRVLHHYRNASTLLTFFFTQIALLLQFDLRVSLVK